MLRVGAILCPYCDANLWKLSHGDPDPAAEPITHPIRGGSPHASIAEEERPAQLSVVVAAIALVARILLSVMGGRAPDWSSLLTVSAWGTTVLAVYAVVLARQAERRIDSTGDKREAMMARSGLILGMATVAYSVSSFVTSSIDLAVSGLL
jgi:hypothetical protein